MHREVDPVLLQDPEFLALHEQFRTKIELRIELIKAAIAHKLRFSVLLFDGWYVNVQLQQGRSIDDIFAYLFAKQQVA